MENSFLHSAEDVLKYFAASEVSGLSEDKVQKARQKYGPNGVLPTYTLLCQNES